MNSLLPERADTGAAADATRAAPKGAHCDLSSIAIGTTISIEPTDPQAARAARPGSTAAAGEGTARGVQEGRRRRRPRGERSLPRRRPGEVRAARRPTGAGAVLRF